MRAFFKSITTAIMLISLVGFKSATAEVFQNVHGGAFKNLSENSVIEVGAVFEFKNLYIKEKLYLENYGTITSDIHIENAIEFTFKNSNEFTGNIHLGNNSIFVQRIESNADTAPLSVVKSDNSLFIVHAKDANVDYANLSAATLFADRIILENTIINANIADLSRAISADLVGELMIVLSGWRAGLNIKLFDEVSGGGKIGITTTDGIGLFIPVIDSRDDGIWITTVRETDYEKILGPGRGKFLNQIRVASPNSKMLRAIDNAESISEIYKTMNNYAAFNPVKLLDAFQIINAADFGFPPNFNKSKHSIGISSFGIFGNDTDIEVAEIFGGIYSENFDFNAKVSMGLINDGVNDAAATFYGLNFIGRFKHNGNYISANLGAKWADFETGPIYDGDAIIYDPIGVMLYSTVEVGTEFINDEYYFAPMLRVRADIGAVNNNRLSDITAGIGMRFGYSDEFSGIRTNRSVFAIIENGNYNIGAGLDIMSTDDDFSAGFYFSRLAGEYGNFYKLGVELRAEF